MGPGLIRKLCPAPCVFTVLVTTFSVVQAQSMDYSEWKPIQWYVAGNITFSTRVSNEHFEPIVQNDSKIDLEFIGDGKHSPLLWNDSTKRYSNQMHIYAVKEEVPQDHINWQETPRAVTAEHLEDIEQTLWSTGENSGDTTKAETKEDEIQSRKKEKKLIKKLAFPLLVLYKIKLLMLIPVLVASLVMLSGSSGLAGFFFAMVATMMAYHKEH